MVRKKINNKIDKKYYHSLLKSYFLSPGMNKVNFSEYFSKKN